MSKIAIVSCYGLYSKELRSEVELLGLEEYNKEVLKQLNEIENLKAVVLCGGYTDTRDLSISEAESNKHFYKELKNGVELLIETSTQDSLENFAFGYLTARKFEPSELIICTDNWRAESARIICKKLFENTDLKLSFVSANREDIHPNSDKEKQLNEILPKTLKSEKFGTLKELISLKIK